MDINTLRAILTLLTFSAFIGVWVWAWSARQHQRFDDSARQIFSDKDTRLHQASALGNHPGNTFEDTLSDTPPPGKQSTEDKQ